MKLSEAIEIIQEQAKSHPAIASAPESAIKTKEWCKTITGLDKSLSTGYSLVGEFWDKKKRFRAGTVFDFYLVYRSVHRTQTNSST